MERGLATAAGAPLSDSAAAEMLHRLGQIALAAGAGPMSKDFIAAARLIKALAGVSAAELPAAMAKALAPPPKKPPRPSKPAAIDPRVAADQLTALSQDLARFDALLNDVAKLPKPKLAEVAKQYLGFERAYKSKDEIARAIRARRLQDEIDGSREAHGSKIAI